MTARSPITTHVLDTSKGRPAVGVRVVLEVETLGQFVHVASGMTNDDGRIADLMTPGTLESGVYRLTFGLADYWLRHGIAGFYPEASIVFEVRDPEQHYHVPLLLNPFGYSTYRGS